MLLAPRMGPRSFSVISFKEPSRLPGPQHKSAHGKAALGGETDSTLSGPMGTRTLRDTWELPGGWTVVSREALMSYGPGPGDNRGP